MNQIKPLFSLMFLATTLGLTACDTPPSDGGGNAREGEGDEGEGEEGEGEEGEGEGGGNADAVFASICSEHQACVAAGSPQRFGASEAECLGNLNDSLDGLDTCVPAQDPFVAFIDCVRLELIASCTVLENAAPPASCDDEGAAVSVAQESCTPAEGEGEEGEGEPEAVDLVGDRAAPDAVAIPFTVTTSVGVDDEDCYEFTLAATTQVALLTSGIGAAECPGDTVIELFASDTLDTVLFEADDNEEDSCSTINESLDANTYTLCVTAFGTGFVNDIELNGSSAP